MCETRADHITPVGLPMGASKDGESDCSDVGNKRFTVVENFYAQLQWGVYDANEEVVATRWSGGNGCLLEYLWYGGRSGIKYRLTLSSVTKTPQWQCLLQSGHIARSHWGAWENWILWLPNVRLRLRRFTYQVLKTESQMPWAAGT